MQERKQRRRKSTRRKRHKKIQRKKNRIRENRQWKRCPCITQDAAILTVPSIHRFQVLFLPSPLSFSGPFFFLPFESFYAWTLHSIKPATLIVCSSIAAFLEINTLRRHPTGRREKGAGDFAFDTLFDTPFDTLWRTAVSFRYFGGTACRPLTPLDCRIPFWTPFWQFIESFGYFWIFFLSPSDTVISLRCCLSPFWHLTTFDTLRHLLDTFVKTHLQHVRFFCHFSSN